MSTQKRKILHLYNRAAFGITPEAFAKVERSPEKEAEALMKRATGLSPIKVLEESPFAKYQDQMGMRGERGAMRQMIQKEVRESRTRIRDMNLTWMNQMLDPQLMVREKLSLFWHDHFGVRNLVGYYAQVHNNTLRKHALGKYQDLLMAVTKDPAMLQFLNNQQNVKRKPNENYARELLELFTLGRGHYTEKDIKEAARAFTGWGFDPVSSKFHFRWLRHDSDNKEFMGVKGDLNGDDIINTLLEQKQTARFLATKLFRYYVSDVPDEALIEKMANRLLQTEYHIGDLLEFIFTSDWFYESRFMHNKIKSPIELINHLRLHFGLAFNQPMAWLYLERVLGQVLFYPPSVNGWPEGREWIDSSSLINRMRLPAVLAEGRELGISPKDDGDNNNPVKERGSRLLRSATVDWQAFMALAEEGDQTELLDNYAALLLNQPVTGETRKAMLSELRKKSNTEGPKWLALALAGLPEYQLS